MTLQDLIKQYQPALLKRFGAVLNADQRQALHAMARCRTPDAGQCQVHCAHCEQALWRSMSCGHRSCPLCQHHEVSQWLRRQQSKLLPVAYFMATFTLPEQLRVLARCHPKSVYACLFACVRSTLKDFGLNPEHLGADMGMTAVLHTHSRRLDYHPHLHVVIPGGGVDMPRRQWKKLKGRYLFNAFALAKVFRARLLKALLDAGLALPERIPKKWVVNVRYVGKGLPALKYLSRYLYRGVISEKNIIAHHDGQVTFTYIDSATRKPASRTVDGEVFLYLLLLHVLPKGFRRVRDYGFLHANAKKRLLLIQLILQVPIQSDEPQPRAAFLCPHCHRAMVVVLIRRGSLRSPPSG